MPYYLNIMCNESKTDLRGLCLTHLALSRAQAQVRACMSH